MILEIGGLLDLGHLLDPELVELCCELLEVVLLLQLCLTGLLLHELGLSGHGVIRGGGWRYRAGWGGLGGDGGRGVGGVVVCHECLQGWTRGVCGLGVVTTLEG